MTSEVEVHIPIQVGYHGKSYLMITSFPMDFLPSVGDIIHPLKNDLDSGLTFEIGTRYWDERGKAVLQIGKCIIDPPENLGRVPRTWNSWSSERDGNLIDLLMANGWWHYDPKATRT